MALQAGERLPDTGADIGNLVYAALILIALGGLAAVARIRKENP